MPEPKTITLEFTATLDHSNLTGTRLHLTTLWEQLNPQLLDDWIGDESPLTITITGPARKEGK